MQDLSLQFMPWKSKNPTWDHNHCEFCSEKIGNPNTPDILHEGYASTDLYRWVCTSCFNDFQTLFNWKVLG